MWDLPEDCHQLADKPDNAFDEQSRTTAGLLEVVLREPLLPELAPKNRGEQHQPKRRDATTGATTEVRSTCDTAHNVTPLPSSVLQPGIDKRRETTDSCLTGRCSRGCAEQAEPGERESIESLCQTFQRRRRQQHRQASNRWARVRSRGERAAWRRHQTLHQHVAPGVGR